MQDGPYGGWSASELSRGRWEAGNDGRVKKEQTMSGSDQSTRVYRVQGTLHLNHRVGGVLGLLSSSPSQKGLLPKWASLAESCLAAVHTPPRAAGLQGLVWWPRPCKQHADSLGAVPATQPQACLRAQLPTLVILLAPRALPCLSQMHPKVHPASLEPNL